MPRWVALLRGINVGGKNIIKMTDLAACFADAGFANVSTYIQSGNVLFESREASGEKLEGRVEKMLRTAFALRAPVVLRSHQQLQEIVTSAPPGFGAKPALYRYDVVYLKAPLTAREAIEQIPTAPGVDQASAGRGVLYFSRLARRASQSRLSRITQMPIYQSMTIRNWNTTTRLLELAAESRGARGA